MKTTHIIILVLISLTIAALISNLGDISSYETIKSAKENPSKFVRLMVKLDKSSPMIYDPRNNPNYFEFSVIDKENSKFRVIYKDAKPTDIEKVEEFVIGGVTKNDSVFLCKSMTLKCPSKYKDQNNSSNQEKQYSSKL